MVSDTGAGVDRAPIPMLMAVGAVHHRLVGTGLRTLATLLVESDEPREVHHFACLLGYGAEAISRASLSRRSPRSPPRTRSAATALRPPRLNSVSGARSRTAS